MFHRLHRIQTLYSVYGTSDPISNIHPTLVSWLTLLYMQNNPDRLDLDRIDPFCFRYLHENCLYQSRRLNNQAIDRFVDNLYSHFNMTYTDAEWTQRRVMCKAFIRRIVRRWMGNNEGGFGFLNEVRGVIKKTPEFIAAWRTRRKDWIQTIHSGLTNGLLETRKGPSSYSPMDKKRVNFLSMYCYSVLSWLTICRIRNQSAPDHPLLLMCLPQNGSVLIYHMKKARKAQLSMLNLEH